jgi:hypothetical protein
LEATLSGFFVVFAAPKGKLRRFFWLVAVPDQNFAVFAASSANSIATT